jgi:uncharacterized protein
VTESLKRPLPQLTDLNRPFWTSGADGVLRLQRCTLCERLVHPPALHCPHDHGVTEYVAVSGRGQVESWTVNHHPWFPGFDPPYIIAFVNPVEDSRVRLLTNLVNVDPDDVTMSMPVRVTFEPGGDDNIYLPVFEPEH